MGKFTQDILIPSYSGNKTEVGVVFAYRTFTFFGRPFQGRSANNPICNFSQIFNTDFEKSMLKIQMFYPYYPHP